MSNDNTGFCTQCGASLTQNDKFCPGCGARVPGRSPEQVAQEKELFRTVTKTRLMWCGFFMILITIPMLCAGVYRLVDVDGIINFLFTDPYWSDLISQNGLSVDEVRSIVENFGYMALASGIFGLISAVSCFTRRFYIVATISCMFCALFATVGLFGLLLGLLVFWMILSSRLGFKEHEAELENVLEETIV